MLQMRQLEKVSERYPSEIETLRAFLRSAEPRPYAYGSLAAVASQVRQAGRFHRDLGSHLMVLKHLGISPPDLLGIVALAAGELNGAATARESDAHEVLRFILTGATASTGDTKPTKVASLRTFTRPSWADALVCVVVLALAVGVVYVRHEAAMSTQRKQAARAATMGSEPNVPQDTPPESAPLRSGEGFANVTPMYKVPSRSTSAANPVLPRRNSYPPTEANTVGQPAQSSASRTYASTPTDRGAIIVRVPANSTSPAGDTRMLGSNVSRNGLPVATPTAVLSQRLGARALPVDDPAIDQSSGLPYPRLLRRNSAGAVTPDTAGNTNLIAVNVPPSRPGSFVAPVATAGFVRPVTLGTMAANIVYSPAPVYPSAAATARVQGQVTIQAEVDRDGSVASARVVSGPPLLRDAALDAVMRWRYRPRTVSGRPVTAAATALVEFELP